MKTRCTTPRLIRCLQSRTVKACAAALAATLALAACDTEKKPELQWFTVTLHEAGVELDFPCAVEMGRNHVDFGMGTGPVSVQMVGCDSEQAQSTFAIAHWLLDDAARADDALAFWEAQELEGQRAVDGKNAKSGASFVPEGAMSLPRSMRATTTADKSAADWTITTHGAWFARREGDKARIFYASIYAPAPIHQTADQFFKRIKLLPLKPMQNIEEQLHNAAAQQSQAHNPDETTVNNPAQNADPSQQNAVE